MTRKSANITLKDHKENFNINPKCCLINPAKSKLGKVAKIIVETINKNVRERLCSNQWRNKSNVIDWISSCTPENPYGFPKINPDRKQLMNPYLM